MSIKKYMKKKYKYMLRVLFKILNILLNLGSFILRFNIRLLAVIWSIRFMWRSWAGVIKGVRLGFIRGLIRCHIWLLEWGPILRSIRLNFTRLCRRQNGDVFEI